MEAKDLKLKTIKELNAVLDDLRRKFQDLKISLAQGKLKDLSQYRIARKDIARVFTVIKQKQDGETESDKK